ncbi:MAG: histidine phosphatase family protein [Pirellulales bacterium]
MTQIVMIRPGSTDYDLQGRIQGTLDVPLNEQGLLEVTRVIEELRSSGIETIYACPCQAATETAKRIAAALNAKMRVLHKLENLSFGLWQGMLVEDVKHKQSKVYRQWQEQPECVCPPEGEMLGQVRERAHLAIAKLLKKHREGIIGLVAPEPLASVVRQCLCQSELGDLWRAATEHATWEKFQVGLPTLAHTG